MQSEKSAAKSCCMSAHAGNGFSWFRHVLKEWLPNISVLACLRR